MKAKTILELASISATLYNLSKEAKLGDKLTDLKDQGKDKINSFMKESMIDKNGNEIEFTEKLKLKAQEAKVELEEKIGEVVSKVYDKLNIAHLDKMKNLEGKFDDLIKGLALDEARIAKLEAKLEKQVKEMGMNGETSSKQEKKEK